MGKVFFTSDLHLFHDRDFIYGQRGFESVMEMNRTIIGNWNRTVGHDDDVYILGDCMLNDNNAGLSVLKRLNGKLHIIRGNHDTDERIALYKTCNNVVEVCEGKFLKINGQQFFLSHYPCCCSNFDDNKPLNKKVVSLCGHVHTKDKWCDWDKGLIYHVELDAHNNTLISFEEIMADIKEKIDK